MFRNKRAMTTFEMLMYIPRLFFIVALMIFVAYIVKFYASSTTDTSELEATLFANRILYSRNSISVFDYQNDRVHPNIIDASALDKQESEKFLENSILYTDKKEIAAKIILKNIDDNSVTTVFYNKDFYNNEATIANSGFTGGPGGAKIYVKNFDVLLIKNSNTHNGILTLSIVVPNS